MAGRPLGLGPAASPPKWWWWLFVVLLGAGLLAMPSLVDISVQLDVSIMLILALLALSMSFLWGYVGILSFGQTAFFGLGGYTYAVLALNLGETTGSMLAALVLPMLFAAVLGYFMIYGRISDIYLSVMTLVVTLILEKGIRATSGDQFVIGTVRLNGQNGIPSVPSLQIPWGGGAELFIDGVFYLAAVLLILVYVGLRLLLLTHFGRVLVSIRENERRTELLGYDSRRYKLAAFVIAGAIAGLSGALYAVWGNFVAPEMFNLSQAAQVIIWVIVGGKSTLIGPIAGTALIQYLTTWLGTQGVGQVTLVLGVVLMVFVLVFNQGLLPTVGLILAGLRNRMRAGTGR
ncbi:MAG: branched-chain amino acid ABC transporter permease [Alphaproteobacteria bacterium]|jgi:branched-chain amino acid transport system permease protein|nr:branched-chain amino acid ABC transporter permease [Alphaproteobacteria bacterium]